MKVIGERHIHATISYLTRLTGLWMHMDTWMHVCIHVCFHACMQYIHVDIHTFMHVYKHTSIHSYKHTSIHSYIHGCVCICVYMHVSTHAWMYACINVEGNEMMDGQTNKWMAGGVIQFHLSMMKIKLIKG